MYRKFVLVAAVGLTALTAACGGGGGVGGDLESVKDGGNEGAIGQATTTTVAAVTTLPPTTVKATVTTVPAQPNAVFTINNDTKGQYIEPLQHAVGAGALVRFVNADDKAHVISGKLNGQTVLGPSPSIAPGASWDVKPTVRGTYDIVDEQRTYAQGVTLTVR